MQKLRESRTFGFAVIVLVYISAAALGVLTARLYPGGLLVRLFMADAAATVLVYAVGALLRNASVYDPYWSVAPPVLFTAVALGSGVNAAGLLLLLAVWLWGIRLTANWAYTFHGLHVQDWRYDAYQKQFPRLWPLVSFFGIHFMPTAVVFLAMIPGVLLVTYNPDMNVLGVAAFALCVASAVLQLAADAQMHRFRKRGELCVCDTGLWRYSRHPNYLGEIGMWWGVFFMLFSARPDLWYTGLGAAANTLLFLCVSIPLMEKRQLQRRPDYAAYRRRTSMLLLLPPRKQAEETRQAG